MTNYSTQINEILQIDFDAGPCLGPCPVFTMTIFGDGTAVYDAKKYNEQERQFKTTIQKEQIERLKALIQLADFFGLEDKYFVWKTCHPTYILTVKEKNGRTKTINDYGPTEPDKL